MADEAHSVLRTNVYKTDSNPRGFVCILNYNSFSGRPDLSLSNATKDTSDLSSIFQKMGYTGHTFTSLTADETKRTLADVRDMDILDEVGCAVFIITSHTTRKDNFLTSDLRLLGTEWLQDFFKDSECPKLRNKPKLFIFDFHCGRYREQYKYLHVPNKIKRFSEPLKDMMCLYSTTKDFTPGGFVGERSQFSSILCAQLERNARSKELSELCRELVRECANTSPTPVLELRNFGFNREFFFSPPPCGLLNTPSCGTD